MSSDTLRAVSAFRLFYDDVVADVRSELRSRLNSETVPLPELQREIGRRWKESARQEEYRKRAEELRQALPQAAAAAHVVAEDCEIPLYRVKRILALDDDAPRVTKETLRVLGRATTIFLSQLAGHVHKHIVESESSYPVKPGHIATVIRDPRYLKYQFLACSEQHLLPETAAPGSTDAATPARGVPAALTDDAEAGAAEAERDAVFDPSRAETHIQSPTAEKAAKKRSCSILNYFGARR